MSSLRLSRDLPTLDRPVLVAAFEGWNDAGEAATGAVLAVSDAVQATPLADIDPDEFFYFQVNRPVVRWEGEERVLDWPATTISWGRARDADGQPIGRDIVLLRGHEPNLRWRTFTETILGLAHDLNVERVVTLGALQVDVPHTRPVPLTGASTDMDIEEEHGLRRSGYEGPTGIVGVLHNAATAAGFQAVTLWVGVPHYLAGTQYAKASLALAERVARLCDAALDLTDVADEAQGQDEDIAELVAEDEELASYVGDLEDRVDAEYDADAGATATDQLPRPPVSGDQIAAEFEQYLQERNSE